MNKVSKPEHYTQGRIECIDAIAAMVGGRGRMDHYRASVVQYIWRCFDKGDTITDLKKDRWYINRLIDELEKVSRRRSLFGQAKRLQRAVFF